MRYRLAHRRYRLSFRVPLRTAYGLWSTREGLIVRLENERGLARYAEVAPIPWFGTETLEEAETYCREQEGQVDDAKLDAVPARLGCVRFAMECARVEAPRPSTNRAAVAALLPPGRVAASELMAALDGGYMAFKWKVGVEDIDEELGVLDELIERLPSFARLRIDSNGGLTRKQASVWLERCAERPIEFFEQPLAPDDADGLRGLARDYPVKLALDESIVGINQARRWQADGWPGVFVLKPSIAGPLSEISAWIAETKPDIVISSAIETAVGRSAILNWALSGGLATRAFGFGIGNIFVDDEWNGRVVGAVADAPAAVVDAEKLWNALS